MYNEAFIKNIENHFYQYIINSKIDYDQYFNNINKDINIFYTINLFREY